MIYERMESMTHFVEDDANQNVTINGERYRVMNVDFFISQLNGMDVAEL